MTLLATFHHSHQINNFWFPRPQPRRCSQPARPPYSPHRQPANFPLYRGRRGAGPHHAKQKTKGVGGRSRGEGWSTFSERPRRVLWGWSGVGGGPGPWAPAGRLLAIVYTSCAPRRTRAGRRAGRRRRRLLCPRPGAAGTPGHACNDRRLLPPLRDDFSLLPKKGKKKHRMVLHIYSLQKHTTETFSSNPDVDLRGFFPSLSGWFSFFFFSRLSFLAHFLPPPHLGILLPSSPLPRHTTPTHHPHSTWGLNRGGERARPRTHTHTHTRAHASRPRSPRSATHSDTQGWGRKAGRGAGGPPYL